MGIGKGLKNTVDQTVEKELESLQIFLRNPRGSKARILIQEEVDYFKNKIKEYGVSPVVVHIPYICNPATIREDLYQLAFDVVKSDLERCDLINADFLVLHPGSHTNSNLEVGIERVAGLLNRVLKQYEGHTKILLETMSGQGNEVGKTFDELNSIIKQIDYKDKVGVCYDTCHTFASGYDCSVGKGVEQIIADLDKAFGKDKVCLVHANDSLKELGSKRDRHAHIGQGFIGLNGFSNIIKHDFFRQLPFILETPLEGLDHDIKVLKELRL